MSVPLRPMVPVLVCLVVTTPTVIASGAGPQSDQVSPDTLQQAENWTANGTPSLRAAQQPAANRTERALSRPPNVTSWNDRYVGGYNTGGVNFSARPSHVSWESCCRLESSTAIDGPLFSEVYIEIFSITPSTIVHSRAGTQRYGSPNGTVRAVSNFRINERLLKSTVDAASANLTTLGGEVELLANGTVVDTSSSLTSEFQYRGLSGTTNLTVRLRLTGTVQSADSVTRSYTMTVTDSETVRVQDLSGLGVSGQLAWRNETGTTRTDSTLTLSVPGLWHRIQFDNGLRAHSQWYYYTRNGDGWVDWETTATEPSTVAPEWQPIAPYEVHAVPVTAGPELTYEWLNPTDDESTRSRDVPVALSYPETSMAPQPSLPPEIGLDRAGNSTTADRFTLHSSRSLREAGEFTVYGLVRGRSVNISVNATDPPTVYEVNLTAEVLNTSDAGTRLRVSARPRAGATLKYGWIIVTTRDTHFVRQLTPADDGTIVVELDQARVRRGRLRYEPPTPWWNQSRTYPTLATNGSFLDTANLPAIREIIDFIVITGLVFLPLYLLLYGFDILTRGKFFGWYEP